MASLSPTCTQLLPWTSKSNRLFLGGPTASMRVWKEAFGGSCECNLIFIIAEQLVPTIRWPGPFFGLPEHLRKLLYIIRAWTSELQWSRELKCTYLKLVIQGCYLAWDTAFILNGEFHTIDSWSSSTDHGVYCLGEAEKLNRFTRSKGCIGYYRCTCINDTLYHYM